jgi:hypothetical protein
MKTVEIKSVYVKIWWRCKNVKNRQNFSDGAVFCADTVSKAADPNSLIVQYARTDTRKFSFGLRVVEP